MTDVSTVGGEPFPVVSTFSGSGGSSCGYERAGLDVAVAVDCAPDTFTNALIDTYRANHPDTAFLERDVRELEASEIVDALPDGIEGRDIGVFDGAPPCSPFSGFNAQGEHGYKHDSGTLFDEYARFVDELEPKYFLAENVQRLAEGEMKGYFRDLYTKLQSAGPGYDLTVNKVDLAHYGSPHHRRRLIFVGSRTDVPTPSHPTTTPVVPLSETLGDVTNDADDVAEARRAYRERELTVGIDRIPEGGALSDTEMYPGDSPSGFTYRRASLDDAAPTFGGKPEVFHPTERRVFTIAECRAIMGLPDDYVLAPTGTFANKWECAARALPPPTMARFAQTVIDAYTTEP